MEREILNKREEKIMNLLWEQNKALTIPEIEQCFSEENLSRASVFKAVQSLMEQEYVCVAGLERTNKTYARRFKAAITREEYAAILLERKGIKTSSLGNVILAMLGNDRNEELDKEKDERLISDLENIIQKLRSQDK